MWALVGLDLAGDVEKWATNTAYVDATGGHNNPKFDFSIVGTPPPNTHGKRDEEGDLECQALE